MPGDVGSVGALAAIVLMAAAAAAAAASVVFSAHHRGHFALVQVRGPGLSSLRPRFKFLSAPV